MKRISWQTLFMVGILMFLHFTETFCQSSGESNKGFRSALFLIEGYGGKRNEWSTPGIAYELIYNPGTRFTGFFSTQLLLWDKQDKRTLSFNIGPQFRISGSESWILNGYIQGGTIIVVGNDYGGFFANFLGGIKLNRELNNSKAFIVGIGINHAMAFNSGFTYGLCSIGFRF